MLFKLLGPRPDERHERHEVVVFLNAPATYNRSLRRTRENMDAFVAKHHLEGIWAYLQAVASDEIRELMSPMVA